MSNFREKKVESRSYDSWIQQPYFSVEFENKRTGQPEQLPADLSKHFETLELALNHLRGSIGKHKFYNFNIFHVDPKTASKKLVWSDKNLVEANFRNRILKRASNPVALLTEVLSKNDSYIMADVDDSKKIDFLREYKNRTGQTIDINQEGIVIRNEEHRVERNKMQLRLFFNATPEEAKQLSDSGLFINESKGSIRKWHRGSFKYILDNVEVIYALIKSGGFHLGPNKNYKENLHGTDAEKELENKFNAIREELANELEVDENSPRVQELRNEKEKVLEELRILEQKRLSPVGASITRRIKVADFAGPYLPPDLKRAQEINASLGNESFSVLLFNLFMRADKDNLPKLKAAFPKWAEVFEKARPNGQNR